MMSHSGKRLSWGCAPVAAIALLLTNWTPLTAAESYLQPGRPDGIALLPPPPAAGSEEEAADLASARRVFKHRTPTEEKRATKDAALSMFIFARAAGPVLAPGKLPKTEALFLKVKRDMSQAIDTPKDHWKRRRPYQLDAELSLGAPEPSASYPSGHSTRGMVYSLLFAEIFPAQREAILQVGREIGWDRVLIGKHYPTDIFAGRVLGKAVFRELMENAEFQRDLAAAKAEAEAACQTAAESNTPVTAAPLTTAPAGAQR